MKICVIVPAYNEQKRIAEVIRSAKACSHDVLVVDDGSTDTTARIAGENGAIVLSFKKNRGKGQALNSGFNYALKKDYDAVVTMDGDGQHSCEDLFNIINSAQTADVGVVVGNRMVDPEDMPFSRFVTNLLMSFIISVICKQNIPDTQCGYRLIKCDVLKKIELASSKYEIESELLIKASRAGFKIVSTPVKSVYKGQISCINPVLDTFRFFRMLVRVLF